jgi:hypothetical protein
MGVFVALTPLTNVTLPPALRNTYLAAAQIAYKLQALKASQITGKHFYHPAEYIEYRRAYHLACPV